jgi:MOSC domain-containing protein YiiM
MEVISVNIGKAQEITYRGKTVKTGIFKLPVSQAILLGKTDVEKDAVIDRKYHGGLDKACYLYSADHYPFWKKLYPDLKWEYGMFGENITVKGLSEAQIQIGDIFQIGDARVQVSQPRQPCFKLGARFESQKIVKQFSQQPFPGIYVRIIEEGLVKKGDTMRLSERLHDSIGLLEVWDLLYSKTPDQDLLEFAVDFQHLATSCQADLRKKLK